MTANLIAWAQLPEIEYPIANTDGYYTYAVAAVQNATITDQSGNNIPIKWTDSRSSQDIAYDSGIILPVNLLSYDESYNVTVLWVYASLYGWITVSNGTSGAGEPITDSQTFTQKFTFHTASAPQQSPNITVAWPGDGNTQFWVTSTDAQTPITVTLTPASKGRPWRATMKAGVSSVVNEISIPDYVHGSYKVCASQPASGDPHVNLYAAAKTCERVTLNEAVSARLADPRVTVVAHDVDGRLSLRLRFPSEWVGQPFRYRGCPATASNRGLKCSKYVNTVVRPSMTITVPVPSKASIENISTFIGSKLAAWMSGDISWGDLY